MLFPSLDQVVSVYSGKAGHCACGCSGKHTYACRTLALAEKKHGRKIDQDQISDRSVAIIYHKVRMLFERGAEIKQLHFNNGVTVTWGDRCYVLYTIS